MPVQKPEELTHLNVRRLVSKDHPRIRFRGQIDLLQAHIVAAQTELEGERDSEKWIATLEEILALLRQVTRSEVLDEPLPEVRILGLTPEELRAQSHDPKTHFGVDPMTPPSRVFGPVYARMNLLRAQTRMAEEAAVAAFKNRPSVPQRQIMQALNRLSSAFHILMCRIQAEHERHAP